MTDKALSLLGLALRGDRLAVGEAPVEEACKARRAELVLTANDASRNSVERAERWARSGNALWLPVPWDKETLGGALGRSVCAMAALTDRGLADALILRLVGYGPAYQQLVEDRVGETPCRTRPMKKKKSRAETKKPAVPEI